LRVKAGGTWTVMRVEFLGASHRYTVRSADGTTAVADLGPDEPLSVGDACDMSPVTPGVASP
jgi:hypothetical protein